MKTILRTVLVIIAFVFAAHAQDRPAATAVESLHFHHVHLNSMNPAAAAASIRSIKGRSVKRYPRLAANFGMTLPQ